MTAPDNCCDCCEGPLDEDPVLCAFCAEHCVDDDPPPACSHPADYRCLDCATDDEVLASLPPFPGGVR